jgi:hypothetical protein
LTGDTSPQKLGARLHVGALHRDQLVRDDGPLDALQSAEDAGRELVEVLGRAQDHLAREVAEPARRGQVAHLPTGGERRRDRLQLTEVHAQQHERLDLEPQRARVDERGEEDVAVVDERRHPPAHHRLAHRKGLRELGVAAPPVLPQHLDQLEVGLVE